MTNNISYRSKPSKIGQTAECWIVLYYLLKIQRNTYVFISPQKLTASIRYFLSPQEKKWGCVSYPLYPLLFLMISSSELLPRTCKTSSSEPFWSTNPQKANFSYFPALPFQHNYHTTSSPALARSSRALQLETWLPHQYFNVQQAQLSISFNAAFANCKSRCCPAYEGCKKM